jgi:hypothetical protein
MKTKNSPPLWLFTRYILLLWLFPFAGYSQDAGSCAEKLKNAQALFEKGQVEQVPAMLSECMRSGFTREESLSAYKLLIQSFLFEEKLEKADSTMLAFLKINPEYQISPTDHSSFVHLYNNFLVKPVLQLTLHVGTNLPFISLIKPEIVAGYPGKSTYNTKAWNLFGSLEAKFELTKKIELNFEAGGSLLSFTNIRKISGISGIMETQPIIGTTTYTESQTRIEIPVTATYNFKSFGKFTPYGRLGLGTALTLLATAQTDHFQADKTPRTGPDLDRKDSRIFMDMFAQAGGGVKLKTRGGYITAELRGNFGLLNQTLRGSAPAIEQELAENYYYRDDDFRTNTLNFSAGYTLIFYKPSKRKE